MYFISKSWHLHLESKKKVKDKMIKNNYKFNYIFIVVKVETENNLFVLGFRVIFKFIFGNVLKTLSHHNDLY